MRRLAVFLALATLSGLGTARAGETVPAEHRELSFSADIPLCGDPSVLARVATKFADKEAAFWNSNLTIVSYDFIKPLAFRPWSLDTIPRRFCTATATVSDGRHHRVDYSVRESTDFAGNGWGVEFCLSGLDRNGAYSPACRMARP